MAGGMSTSLSILLVLSSCSWMLAGGQTCSLSGAGFSLHAVTVSAEREDGPVPGARVTWSTTAPPECVASFRVEFRTRSPGSVQASYNTTDISQREVIQTGLQGDTSYYVRVVVTGISSLGLLISNEVQVLVGAQSLPIHVRFINGSPVVDGNSVRAQIVANLSTASLQCELLRREQLESPMVANCSSGSVSFTGVPPGRYRLRVVASAPGHSQSVIRRRVVIPEGPNYCTANLIDEGAVTSGSNMTVHFRGVGPVREFLCVMDRQTKVPCNPPIGYTGMEQGEHHFKVIPLGCGKRYTALPFRFNVPGSGNVS